MMASKLADRALRIVALCIRIDMLAGIAMTIALLIYVTVHSS